MNHAKKIQRAHKAHKRYTAKRDTPTIGKVQRNHAKAKRRQRNSERQTTVSTCTHASNAFVKTSFFPKLDAGDAFPLAHKAKMERDFFKSLSLISDLYHLSVPDTDGLDYPFNIISSWKSAREQLKETTEEWSAIRLLKQKGQTFFAKQQTFDTGRTLFYIPVAPLFLVLKDPVKRRAGLLLQAIFAHLFIVSDIAYFRLEGSYMKYVYTTIRDWHLQEYEEDDSIIKELNVADWIGDFMQRKINNLLNLTRFQSRLDGFLIKNEFDRDCYNLAMQFSQFIKDYPQNRLDENIKQADTNSEDYDYDTGTISLENYVSFYSSASGELSDQVVDFVNSDLQEMCLIDEPILYKPFDNRKLNKLDFSFEQAIFDLIEELISLLHKIEQKDGRYY